MEAGGSGDLGPDVPGNVEGHRAVWKSVTPHCPRMEAVRVWGLRLKLDLAVSLHVLVRCLNVIRTHLLTFLLQLEDLRIPASTALTYCGLVIWGETKPECSHVLITFNGQHEHQTERERESSWLCIETLKLKYFLVFRIEWRYSPENKRLSFFHQSLLKLAFSAFDTKTDFKKIASW